MATQLFSPRHTPKNVGRSSAPIVWVVGAGKGGVGKSFASSSLAICLSRLGYSITLVDLDFGGANLHTCVGAKPTTQSLKQYIDGDIKDLNQITTPTGIPNCLFIPGLWDAWNPVQIDETQRKNLFTDIKKLKSQFVIIDLGAGAYEGNLDFFKFADKRILVTTPEATSIENLYRYLETLLVRVLHHHCNPSDIKVVVDEARRRKDTHAGRPFSFEEVIKSVSLQKPNEMLEMIRNTPVQLILNQSRSHADTQLGYSIGSVSRKYFGLPVQYLGHLDYDNIVWQAMRKKSPPILENPFTRLVGQFLSISKALIDLETVDKAA